VETVAKRPPDGYTVMVYAATVLATAHLCPKLPYDVLKDFIGLSPVARIDDVGLKCSTAAACIPR
jgi:hypothetical protein